MAAPSTHRDPRSIVTPDAFEVSEALLGMPLAPPRKRLIALLIDLMVIGFLTLVTRSFALVLGVVAAIFFMRAGFKRTPVKGSVFGRAMRLSVGCLGFFIAILTAVVWSSCGVDFQRGGDEGEPLVSATADGGAGTVAQVLAALAAPGVLTSLADAETIEEAEEAARGVIELAEEMGLEPDALHELLSAAVRDDAPWADGAEALFSRLLGEDAGDGGDVDSDEVAALQAEVGAYTVEDALEAYAAVLGTDLDEEANRVRLSALQTRLMEVVAADTLETLGDRISDLERTSRSQRQDLTSAAAALSEASSGGLFGWLREFVDELGFGFGWASLYLTIILSWWNGQSVGKKAMGIRVVRLDGEPITWWVAFERAGGYAAGFATGLLGFAQVYWDANRQGIHDRIVGTVVILEDAEKVDDWESAL